MITEPDGTIALFYIHATDIFHDGFAQWKMMHGFSWGYLSADRDMSEFMDSMNLVFHKQIYGDDCPCLLDQFDEPEDMRAAA